VIHVPRTRLCRSRPFGLKKVRLSATTLRGSLRRLVISSTAVSLPLIRCKMSEKSWKVSALTVTVTSMTPPCSLRSFASMQLIPMSKKSTEERHNEIDSQFPKFPLRVQPRAIVQKLSTMAIAPELANRDTVPLATSGHKAEESSHNMTPSRPATHTGNGRHWRSSLRQSLRNSIHRLSLQRGSSSRKSPSGKTEKNPGVSKKEQDQLDCMLDCLSQKELEAAACASYCYSQRRQVLADSETTKSESAHERRKFAALLCLNFLRSKNHCTKKALSKLKATLAFRDDTQIDKLRTVFDRKKPVDCKKTSSLLAQLEQKAAYVQGYDKDGRATYIFVPRRVHNHDETSTLNLHVYTLERALACSQSDDGQVNAVVDFYGFSYSQHAPPTHVGKHFLNVFRQHYAGAVHHIFIVDAPRSFRFLWTIFAPFIGQGTREKIKFLKSVRTASKQSVSRSALSDFYDREEATPWMVAGGEKECELDLNEYLYNTRFDQAFGDSRIAQSPKL
jgi:hypothetical protein